jgi:RNA polymerase sigma factor (sigma-70 family)
MNSSTSRLSERTAHETIGPTSGTVAEARRGSGGAREQLLVTSLPGLERWAHGRVPLGARSHMDTCDLVQEAALRTFARLAHFVPEHSGSMPAYLRRAASNTLIDEARRQARQQRSAGVLDEPEPFSDDDPLSETIRSEARARYRTALRALRRKDRRLLLARHHLEWSLERVAQRLGLKSPDAARMAVRRAERRLHDQLACRSI